MRICGYVLKLIGVHKLKVLGSTDINDMSYTFISIWQIFFEKFFVVPNVLPLLEMFFCLQVISHVTCLSFLLFRIYFYFLYFP